MAHRAAITVGGSLGLRIIRQASPVPAKELTMREIWQHAWPRQGLSSTINRWRMLNLPNLWRGLRPLLLSRRFGLCHIYGQLSLVVMRNGQVEAYGLASLRAVTDVGVAFMVDAYQDITELETMKYHALGTGTNAENASDTALQTELTTEYTGDVRATGTTAEGASANIYQTVATNTIDSGTPAVTEHGVMDQAATGGGVLLDRSVFAAINLAASDSLQSTFSLTLPSGG